MPRRDHDLRGEARGRRLPRRHGRRHHRGGLPHRLGGRLRGGAAPSPSASRTRRSPGSRAPSSPTSTAPARRCATRKRGRIHTFVSTSPIHLAHQMRKTEAEVLEIITATVARARNLVEDVEWSAMDATRTGIDYLCRCVEAAIKAGATTINLPDTVGYATPEEYAGMFRAVRERVPGADQRDLLHPLPQRPGARRSPTRWPRSAPARGRSSAPSTASASGPATRRSKRS